MIGSKTIEVLASVLNSMKIGRGNAVILKMSRSEKLLFAALGIIRSGSILVPVEPDIPAQRLEIIRKACNAVLVIDDEQYSKLVLNEVSASLCDEKTFLDEDIALILFTSGSTGIPKGVCHSRRSFKRLMNVMGEYFASEKFNFGDVVSLTELSFVSSFMFEIGPALFLDKQILMAGDEEKNSSTAVSKLIQSSREPLVFMTPSKYLAFSKDNGFCDKLRKASVLCLTGEKLDSAVEKKMLCTYPDSLKIFNVYASTECGVMFIRDIRTGKFVENGEIALVEGEICVYDKDRFSGYLGGAEKKTVEFKGKPYIRTGDLGKRCPDGSITVLGRSDRMIKLHGLRIELDEIEWNVKQVKAIDSFAVVFDSDKQQIHCFYTSDSDIDDGIFLNTLKDRLPYYMIPSVFHHIENLPLNSHGKVDYQKLKKEALSLKARQNTYNVTLNNELLTSEMKALIECSAAVLHTSSISLESSLVALGMDSLHGIELIRLMEEKLLKLKLADIFLCSSVRELSTKLTVVDKSSRKTVPGKKSYPIDNTSYQMIISAQLNGLNSEAFMCCESFVIRKVYSKTEWIERANTIQMNHPALRTIFEQDARGKYVQTISDCPVACVEYFDLSGIGSGNVGIISRQQQVFIDYYEELQKGNHSKADLSKNVTLTLFKIDDEYSVVFYQISHVISDGVSLAVLKGDVCADVLLYREDSFYEYKEWTENPTNRMAAIEFNRKYLSDVYFAIFPGGTHNPFASALEITKNLKKYTIDFGPMSALKYETAFSHVVWRYGRAAMDTLGVDSIMFYITSSGRSVDVCAISRVVSGLSNYIPVVLRRSETQEEFMNGVRDAEKLVCMPNEELMRNVFGNDYTFALINLPAVISHIFPDLSGGKVVDEYSPFSITYNSKNAFLYNRDGRMILELYNNSANMDESVFEVFVENLRRESKN